MRTRTLLTSTVAAASLAVCLAFASTPLAFAFEGGLLAGIASGIQGAAAEADTGTQAEAQTDVSASTPGDGAADEAQAGATPLFDFDFGFSFGSDEAEEPEPDPLLDLVRYESVTHGAVSLQAPAGWSCTSETEGDETYVEYESEWGLFQLMVTDASSAPADDNYVDSFLEGFSADLLDFAIAGHNAYFLDGTLVQTFAYTANLDEETPVGGYITFMMGNDLAAVAASAFINDTAINGEIPCYTHVHTSIGLAVQGA